MSVWVTRCPECREKLYTAPCQFCGQNDYNKSLFSQGLVCNVCGRTLLKGLECPYDGHRIEWWKLLRKSIFS